MRARETAIQTTAATTSAAATAPPLILIGNAY